MHYALKWSKECMKEYIKCKSPFEWDVETCIGMNVLTNTCKNYWMPDPTFCNV